VHYSSGIANLAFYLMSQGGTHPRGKSTVQVAGIGMAKAIRVFYLANTNILTSSSKFAAAATACITAAGDLGFTQAEKDSVQNAWAAVGVGQPAGGGGGGGGGGGSGEPQLSVTNISASKGTKKYWQLAVPAGATGLGFAITGGSGDADLYVKYGSQPTTTSYDCRPYKLGNEETCNFTTAKTGTYHVMIVAYSAYSGVSLTGKYTASGGGGGGDDSVLQSGVPVPNLSGATGATKTWSVNAPAGARLVVTINGGSGDADLYTKFGTAPTTTSYDCRPYLNGNAETCTVTSTQAGTYYVMLRAYTSYSGVTLTATY
jgi:hypothetical protein